MAPQVAAQLDPKKAYGIWYYNRKRVKSSQVSEAGPEGRVYRRKRNNTRKDKSEWIAVPVPDAGIPLEVLEAARRTVRDYKTGSKASGRFWQLSGTIARCALCQKAIIPRPVRYKLKSGGTSIINYYRCSKAYSYNDRCTHTKVYRAEELEARVWNLVLSLLRDPERLRAVLDKFIEEERKAHQGDPEREARAWLRKIAEVDRTRGRYQDMAAEGLITFDELRTKLAALEDTREAARRELDALAERRERLAELEGDKAALLETYSEKASEGLDTSRPRSATRPIRSCAWRSSSIRAGISRSPACSGRSKSLSTIKLHPGVSRGKGSVTNLSGSFAGLSVLGGGRTSRATRHFRRTL